MQKAKSHTIEDFGLDVIEDCSDPSDRELTLEVGFNIFSLLMKKGSKEISMLNLCYLFSSLGYPLLCFFDK